MQPDIFKKIIFIVFLFLLVFFSSRDIKRWAQGIFRRKELKKDTAAFLTSLEFLKITKSACLKYRFLESPPSERYSFGRN